MNRPARRLRLKPALKTAWTFCLINLATGGLVIVVPAAISALVGAWWLVLLGIGVLGFLKYRQGGLKAIASSAKDVAGSGRSGLAKPLHWYFGPEHAVERAVSWCLWIVGGALMMFVFFGTIPLMEEYLDLSAEDADYLHRAAPLVVALGAGYLLVAAAVIAHACWQSYRSEKRLIDAAAQVQVDRIHQLFRDRRITSEHVLGLCQACGLVEPLFLGQSTDCTGCGRHVSREGAVRVAV